MDENSINNIVLFKKKKGKLFFEIISVFPLKHPIRNDIVLWRMIKISSNSEMWRVFSRTKKITNREKLVFVSPWFFFAEKFSDDHIDVLFSSNRYLLEMWQPVKRLFKLDWKDSFFEKVTQIIFIHGKCYICYLLRNRAKRTDENSKTFFRFWWRFIFSIYCHSNDENFTGRVMARKKE